jgi:hypothetical protein
MRVLLWVLLVFSVLCTLGCVGGMIRTFVNGKVTNVDYLMIVVGGMMLVVDVVGGAAGVVLTVAVLDDTGAKTLAGWMTAVPLGFLAVFAALA